MDTTTATAPAPAEPAAAKRLPLLDVLRGVAILGTLGTNIWLFTSAHGEAGPLLGFEINDGGPVGSAFQLLANGKFLSMLTVLFGVGLAIQYRSAEKRGRRWPGRYHWRALFLFAEGTVHFVLLFAWDVLMGYAVTAITVAWLLKRSERAQRAAMWTALGLHLALVGLITAGAAAGGIEPRPEPEVQALYATGTWSEQVQFRLDNAIAFRIEPVITFPLLVFLFLLGVRLFRSGAFAMGADGAGERGRRIRARLMAWGLGLGLPLNTAALFAPAECFYLERYVIAPVVMLGYIGLVGFLVEHVRRGPVTASLESLGRTALSGYILQNLLASVACYGWGLGLAARYGSEPWLAPALWLGIGALLLAGSWLWLRRFANGPAESLQKAVLR
ncbi:DUF418 domain-containing protein [Glycomyces albidus]|uniref:DUF418 domain-containing protein n=1 Tax=Glycomyces albidus TaxID=2656774 RepID=A0A6L5GC54_9ACTN|nr:DUF418 domain-containing protein [Glycomyces albidus]MQM27123.1 DUF418 domain-containing protein [Glycomyces albidus]